MLAFFENLVDPFPTSTSQRPPRGLLAFVWHYAKPVTPSLLIVILTASVFAALEIAMFGFLGSLVDFFATADRATFWQDHAAWLITVGIVVLFVMPTVDLLHELTINQSVLGNLPMRVRWLAHRYLLRQSMSFFQDDFAGRITTKVMQTATAVKEVVALVTEVFVYVLVYFAGALWLFAQGDVRLMVPLALWGLAYGVAMRFFVPRMRDLAKEIADKQSEMTGRVVDSYTNIQTVKLFAHAAREESYARDSMAPLMGTVHKQYRLVTLLNFCLESMNGLLLVSVGLLGAWLWTQEAATAGAVALAVGLVLRLKGMSHWIMWEIAALFEHIGTIQDGMETIAQQYSLTDRTDAKQLAAKRGAIGFDSIRFHYGKETGVIEDLSFAIEPGERVGLVGPSGAGKSTVVNLLLRFYDSEAGRITIDGQDIAEVTQESLRATIGLVSQDTSLLHRSVRDNVRYGRPEASDEEVEAALRAAKADGFVPDLLDLKGRHGLDAHVGERGVKLSGGQRQRVAIARVILKDAPILVLDEATSALDSEVEAAIQESLTELMAGKTVIAIAHRLSTIAAMDRLIVMERGRIVEQGCHEELLAKGGLYARLWARQSGGFIDAGSWPLDGKSAAQDSRRAARASA